MNQKKEPFSDPRWNDTSKPKIIGYREIPPEEQVKYKEQLNNFLRKSGVIKKDYD
ncbi:hypothetical protein P4H67_25790 [Paenibacillus lautus]|uniref:hypothetical protein n=1 Tax=Paenibacillus lautus TaxID=1401 RepID=UPI002DBF7D0D|nr:hypothetical protein [Paenibacillus lautus]MEC0310171.1 hypothetical protein [Paenibacillus lautus]